MLVGAGCNTTPAAPEENTVSTTETVTSTPVLAEPTAESSEIAVQNFGDVAYMPTVVKSPVISNKYYDGDELGWWKVGEDRPGRAVFVLIEGSDEYFYATNQDRSVEVRGQWKFTPGGKLQIETPRGISTTFSRWVFVDETVSYVLRGKTWEKWEKVVDPMLP